LFEAQQALWLGAPTCEAHVWPLAQHALWPCMSRVQTCAEGQQTGSPLWSVMQVWPTVQQTEVLVTVLWQTRLFWQHVPPTQTPEGN
jgi:hypothetical protein